MRFTAIGRISPTRGKWCGSAHTIRLRKRWRRAWAEEQIRRRLENLLTDGAEDEPLRLRLEAAGAGDELPLRQKIKPALGSGGK